MDIDMDGNSSHGDQDITIINDQHRPGAGGMDDSMDATLVPGQNYPNGHDHRPQTSYSDTTGAFSRSYTSHSDADSPRGQSGSSAPYGYKPGSRPGSGMGYTQQQQLMQQQEERKKETVVLKVGMVGDAQIGKTSLMVKYVEGSWDEDYIQTLGVNFMEKTITIRNTDVTFSIWDLGGQREFVNMLPLVCNDAVAILFMFDLTRKSTLNSIKEWYRQGRGFNKTAIPFLVGTKYDHFVNFPREDQEEISNQAKRFAKAMKASLIFSSTSHSINVQKIFKIVLSKAFDLRCTIPEIEHVGEPLLLYLTFRHSSTGAAAGASTAVAEKREALDARTDRLLSEAEHMSEAACAAEVTRLIRESAEKTARGGVRTGEPGEAMSR